MFYLVTDSNSVVFQHRKAVKSLSSRISAGFGKILHGKKVLQII